MPSKSRRNRRSLQNKKITGSSAAAATPIPESTAQAGQVSSSYSRTARTATTTTLSFTHFGRDLRWTGIVTAIVVVLLVVAYIVFR